MMAIPNRVRVLALMLALALVGGLLTLALLAKPSQAKPPTDNENRGAETFREGHAFTIGAIACTGEYIQLTGTAHLVGQYFETDGGYHWTSRGNLSNTKGVGLDPQTLEPTGTKYIVTSAGGFTENFVPAGALVSSSVGGTVIIGKGQADSQVGHSVIHYIIEDVDGEQTVKVEKIEVFVKCQPGNTSPTATASATAAAGAADTKASPTATKASPTATDSPGTGSAPLAMGAGVLLAGAGLAARRLL